MNLFTYGGKFSYYMEKTFDMIALSILWLICCIPLVTVGASTTALYYAVNKSWKQDNGYIARAFFHGFRMSFKPALGLWILIGTMTFVFQLN
ncbi:MAG TPA: YesL family protein, partial [Candidatus Pelethocola excrementipullorum]|nr:YesL family protein [Candidatus Pelethocola excrementipullorum]